MSFLDKLKENLLKQNRQIKIVYAEGWNAKIQIAVKTLINNKIIEPILIFRNKNEVCQDIECQKIVIGETDLSKYANALYELRKDKGLSEQEAKELVKNPNYLASLLVKLKEADGEICGIEYTTKDTLKPALQIVKTSKQAKLVTSAFIMEKDDKQIVFGDCAININPSAEELANIAKMIALFAKKMVGYTKTRVSLLSYSTMGSGQGESVKKVVQAYEIIKDDQDLKQMSIDIKGEMQFDASYVMDVMRKKAKNVMWEEPANVYIFPNIDAGNIGYKIAQRMGNWEAIGPVLIGLAAPINDLSRGASSQDVIGLTYITANQAINN